MFKRITSWAQQPPPDAQVNRDHPLSRDLIGFWPLIEGSGSVAKDYSGFNNHASFVNSAAWDQTPAISTKSGYRGGTSVAFNDATQDHLVTDGNIYPQTGPASPYSGTYGCWYRITGNSSTLRQVPLTYRRDSSDHISFQWNDNQNKIRGRYEYTGNDRITNYDFDLDTLTGRYHLVFAFSNGSQSLYLNGVEVATSTSTLSAFQTGGTPKVFIGNSHATGDGVVGNVSDCRIWDRKLGPAEVWDWYTNQWGIFESKQVSVGFDEPAAPSGAVYYVISI